MEPSPEETHDAITITLTPDQEQKLAELARLSGKDPSVYVHDVVTAHLNGAGPRRTRTLEFEAVLPRLVTLFDQGRLVPFVGLGLSLPTCSTWPESINLLGKAATEMGLGEFPDMTRVARDDLPRWVHRIVSLLKRAPGNHFPDVMRKALYLKPPDPANITSQTKALARFYWPLVLTTNYDDLLYRAVYELRGGWAVRGRSWYDCDQVVAGLTGPAPPTLGALQGFLPYPGGPFGRVFAPEEAAALEAELAAQMVVGHEEYRRVTHREPWFRRAFAEVFRSRSFLFLGSGLAENYLLELFGEALEMTGMSPYPHYAFVQKGEVAPDFLRSRLNILVIEYPRGKHEHVAEQLNSLAEAVEKDRLKPASLGFSFRMPAFLRATPDVPDLLLVRGTLPSPGLGECVGISCGRGVTNDGRAVPLVGGDETRGMVKFLKNRRLTLDAFDWVDDDKTLGIFRRTAGPDQESPYYGLVARTVQMADPVVRDLADVKDLRLIPEVCQRFLTTAAERGFVTARLMIIAGGPSAPFPPLHAVIQMARGIRDWFHENSGSRLRVVVHLVDQGVWFNIQSGRLNLAELLSNDTVQVVVMVRNPDGSASRQYRLVGPSDTPADLAATVHVPLQGWTASINPSPVREAILCKLYSNDARTPLFNLGLIPGSTVRFAMESPFMPPQPR